jgi:DDE superfamily endonuclease
VICADELGPVIPRTFAPAAGWSPDGHRIKAPLEYARGPDKTWVYGALRIRDGQELTCCAPARTSAGWLRLLQAIAEANPRGAIRVVTDNLSSHSSLLVRRWLIRSPAHPAGVHPQGGLLAESAGGLVAAAAPGGVRGTDLRRHHRNHPGRADRHRATQHPCQTLGLGTTTTTHPQTPPHIRVPALRNAALVS